MLKKVIFAVVLTGLVSGLAVMGSPDPKEKGKKMPLPTLVSMLPPSDAVVAFDSDRFFSQALPQLLSGNQKLFVEMMSKVDEIRQMTGIDLRQFDEVVVGVSAKGEVGTGKADFQPLILARGKFSSDALVAIVKIAGSGRYREEQVGQRAVFIFSPSELMAKNKPQGSSGMDGLLLSILNGLDREMALTAYDSGTLAIGTPERVRELLEGKAGAEADILSAMGARPKAVLRLAMKTPKGMEDLIKLDNDMLGRNLKGIRVLSGALDVAGSNAMLDVSVKMASVEQATGIKQTLDGFKSFLPALFGGGKKNNQVFGRLVEGARLTRVGSNVSLSLTMPQSDIDVLIGGK